LNILYTTHCPKCNTIESLLKKNNIEYAIVDDTDIMLKEEIDLVDNGNVPVFDNDGNRMGYTDTINWIKGNVK
jgi:Glutaredoxin.